MLEARALPRLRGWSTLTPEHVHAPGSRVDFHLTVRGRAHDIEVKNCHLVYPRRPRVPPQLGERARHEAPRDSHPPRAPGRRRHRALRRAARRRFMRSPQRPPRPRLRTRRPHSRRRRRALPRPARARHPRGRTRARRAPRRPRALRHGAPRRMARRDAALHRVAAQQSRFAQSLMFAPLWCAHAARNVLHGRRPLEASVGPRASPRSSPPWASWAPPRSPRSSSPRAAHAPSRHRAASRRRARPPRPRWPFLRRRPSSARRSPPARACAPIDAASWPSPSCSASSAPRVDARWRNGRWQVLVGGTAVGALLRAPAPSSTTSWRCVSEWPRGLAPLHPFSTAAAPPELAAWPALAPSRPAVATLSALDAAWSSGHRSRETLATAARALTALAVETPDALDGANLVTARALAALAWTRSLGQRDLAWRPCSPATWATTRPRDAPRGAGHVSGAGVGAPRRRRPAPHGPRPRRERDRALPLVSQARRAQRGRRRERLGRALPPRRGRRRGRRGLSPRGLARQPRRVVPRRHAGPAAAALASPRGARRAPTPCPCAHPSRCCRASRRCLRAAPPTGPSSTARS